MRSLSFFQFAKSFQLQYGPWFDSTSNRNEYQEDSWGGKGLLTHKSDNLTTVCELII
jgi:hypothetical protein